MTNTTKTYALCLFSDYDFDFISEDLWTTIDWLRDFARICQTGYACIVDTLTGEVLVEYDGEDRRPGIKFLNASLLDNNN